MLSFKIKRSTYEKNVYINSNSYNFYLHQKDIITLNVFNWAEYIDETLLDQFEKEII